MRNSKMGGRSDFKWVKAERRDPCEIMPPTYEDLLRRLQICLNVHRYLLRMDRVTLLFLMELYCGGFRLV